MEQLLTLSSSTTILEPKIFSIPVEITGSPNIAINWRYQGVSSTGGSFVETSCHCGIDGGSYGTLMVLAIVLDGIECDLSNNSVTDPLKIYYWLP